jgi:hypothetical protein
MPAAGRSGDQFCVYVADRLVLPTLAPKEVRRVATGELQLDARVRDSTRHPPDVHPSWGGGASDAGSVARELSRLVLTCSGTAETSTRSGSRANGPRPARSRRPSAAGITHALVVGIEHRSGRSIARGAY